MSDQTAAGLEEPLLKLVSDQFWMAKAGPAAQQIADVIGDDPEQQADLIGPEPMTREPCPVNGFFALLDQPLRGPALVVENRTTARLVPVSVVTMKPIRGNNSPR